MAGQCQDAAEAGQYQDAAEAGQCQGNATEYQGSIGLLEAMLQGGLGFWGLTKRCWQPLQVDSEVQITDLRRKEPEEKRSEFGDE